ncbi:uncharacterized protein PG998_001416 [Apiospora kogelbergensis]|uniref:uncharacterized protein n=1 Tax=Apiospora kogelbergensis TaxID=1337665 RepID=UPI00312FCBB6
MDDVQSRLAGSRAMEPGQRFHPRRGCRGMLTLVLSGRLAVVEPPGGSTKLVGGRPAGHRQDRQDRQDRQVGLAGTDA